MGTGSPTQQTFADCVDLSAVENASKHESPERLRRSMPSDWIRGWIPGRVTKTRLVQQVAAAGHAVEAHCRIELCQFRLQLLVDEQQRLQRAADVAIAGRHD